MKTNRSAMVSLVACLPLFVAHAALAFYNPETGRWLNRDPIGESGGDNEYSFVNGGSTDAIDVLGLARYEFHDNGWHYVPRVQMQSGLYGETPTEIYEIGSQCICVKKIWQPRFTFKVKTASKILEKADPAWSGSGAGILDPKARHVFQTNANHLARRNAVRTHERQHRKHAKKDYKLVVGKLKQRENEKWDEHEVCEERARIILAGGVLYFNSLESAASAKIEAGKY